MVNHKNNGIQDNQQILHNSGRSHKWHKQVKKWQIIDTWRKTHNIDLSQKEQYSGQSEKVTEFRCITQTQNKVLTILNGEIILVHKRIAGANRPVRTELSGLEGLIVLVHRWTKTAHDGGRRPLGMISAKFVLLKKRLERSIKIDETIITWCWRLHQTTQRHAIRRQTFLNSCAVILDREK